MKQCELFENYDPQSLSLKMLRGCLRPIKGTIFSQYWKKLPTLGTMVNGNLSIQSGFYPKIESGYTLSEILEKEVDQKYFLSKQQQDRIMNVPDHKPSIILMETTGKDATITGSEQ